MGTPSRVKGGLQEMRMVVELMRVNVITVRLLTDSNKPIYVNIIVNCTNNVFTWLVYKTYLV